MAESCTPNPTLARKITSTILQRLASVGQKPVADALSVSEATVSRMKGEGLESFSALLGTLGLKVVPATHKCYAPEYIEHLHYFAQIGMQDAKPQLADDFDE